MSRETKKFLPPDWVQKKLASRRRQLEETGEWPETADSLLADLSQPDRPPVGGSDIHMLSLVINDALEGIDITTRYPAFYQNMLGNTRLRHAFLAALDLLEADAAGELESMPQESSHDLSFLQTAVSPHPVIEQTWPDRWRVVWHLLGEQLNRRFFQLPQRAFRGETGLLDDESIMLLRSDLRVGSQRLDVILEAASPVDAPDQLHLALLVAALDDAPLPAMQASVQWGAYQATAVADAYGRTTFPPLLLVAILDENEQAIQSDLRLKLEIT